MPIWVGRVYSFFCVRKLLKNEARKWSEYYWCVYIVNTKSITFLCKKQVQMLTKKGSKKNTEQVLAEKLQANAKMKSERKQKKIIWGLPIEYS